MATLIFDPELESEVRANRALTGADRFDEVWDGVYVMAPLANNEHQELAARLARIFASVLDADDDNDEIRIFQGVNVSDQMVDWTKNYRCPDVAVYLPTTTARDMGTHWYGGPDFAVEITSPKDHTRDKLPFYAKVNTRELLIVDRDPWALELFRLQDGEMKSVGRRAPEDPAPLSATILPVTFSLRAQPAGRTRILVTHRETGRSWKA